MKLYKPNSLIPSTSLDLKNKRIYFYGGVFSQFHISQFYDSKVDKTFTCAEQAMMYYKAITFNDIKSANMIHNTNSATKQKSIGRSVLNYDDSVWNSVRYDIVVRNNLLKFLNNDYLKDLLLFSNDYEIVEASPTDKIWGVGLSQDDPKILDKNNWQGDNLLGKALMEVRNIIISNYI